MTVACPACVGAPLPQFDPSDVAADVTLSVPDIRCGACVGKVENALNTIPGVSDARVNLTLKRVSARTGRPIAELLNALSGIGYTAHPMDNNVLGASGDTALGDLGMRLGVAGFAMMNVMLLSVAVWSGATGATRELFHLISAAISHPAVAFSAQPFFRSAWTALRVRQLNMDVPISLAILLAALMSLYEALNGGQHAYFDAALSLTFFLLIGRFLDHRTRMAARSAAKELAALEVHTAERIANGTVQQVRAADLAVGDQVLVATGMRVPIDGALLDETALTDRSFLTGESATATSKRGELIQAGEINLGAPVRLHATAVGEDTTLRRVARLVEQAENARNGFTSLADRAARIYAPAVHLLALAAFAIWLLLSADLRLSLNIAIAVLIITCPCALGLAVPAVATAAMGKLYELGFLVKSGTALERLAQIYHVVFDKTGTLTLPDVSWGEGALDADAQAIALALAQHSHHPVARALVKKLKGVNAVTLDDIEEFAGLGVSARVGPLPVQLGQGEWVGAKAAGLYLRIGEQCIGLTQSERPRPGAAQAITVLAETGINLTLISGDKAEAVNACANKLGLADIHSGMSPEAKHKFITQLNSSGTRVAMIGDGLNDTAALSAAYASVAPSSALEASRNAADVVLLHESLENLPRLFSIARAYASICRQNFTIATAYNLIAVPIALLGYATPLIAAIAMSVSSLTVLLNSLRVRMVK